ncbi:MAG: NosD domain-containing protein [Euryarchaeota archaeon]|nr:NosD domain-containing protein [Euryarchaeota archaeon]
MKIERRNFWAVLLIAVIFATLTFVSVGCASGATHYVDPGESIQAAVNTADPHDTIIVRDGTYTENINVNKSLTIQSENGSDVTIVQAAYPDDHVFEVTVDYVNIGGFNVTGETGSTGYQKTGIYLNNVNKCAISNNTANGNGYGIHLSSSSNNSLTGNTANSNNWNGIYLSSSSNNSLTGNTANSNNDGIYLRYSSNNNNLTGNIASNNYYGIYLSSSSNNSLIGNTASNNTYGIYLSSSSNNSLTVNTANSNNEYGIELYRSSNNNLTGNTASNNSRGIWLRSSSNNNLTGDTANSNNKCGIELDRSSNNNLTGNTANSNNEYGIYLSSSSNNSLTGNTMVGDGIYIWGSELPHWNTHSIDTSNTVNSKQVRYWKDQVAGTVPPDAGQVILANCTNITIENQNVSDGTVGIIFGFSDNNNLIDNTANSNNEYGIYMYRSSNNNLEGNTASNNSRGIYLSSSSNNRIYLNNFISNDIHVHTQDSANIWNSSAPITYTYNGSTFTSYLGNYWDNYTDVDSDDDGIWDTPYSIDSGNQDDYPLVEEIPITMIDGDLNHDNRITPADAAIALAIAASGAQNPAADVSGDGQVTSLDALMILQAVAGG